MRQNLTSALRHLVGINAYRSVAESTKPQVRQIPVRGIRPRLRLLATLSVAFVCAAVFIVTERWVSAETAPVGWIDGANCNAIAGWALDQDTPSSSIEVHLWDGPAGAGGTFINNYPTTTERGDVNAAYGVDGNHGFEFGTPAQFHDGGTHYVYVYAINSNGEGPHTELPGSGAAINCGQPSPPPDQTPIGSIDRADCTAIAGWTLDLDTPSASASVNLFDGPWGSGGTFIANYPTSNPRGDINAAYGVDGNHGFEISTPSYFLDGNTHYVYVYGINTNSEGAHTQLPGSGAALTCQPPTPDDSVGYDEEIPEGETSEDPELTLNVSDDPVAHPQQFGYLYSFAWKFRTKKTVPIVARRVTDGTIVTNMNVFFNLNPDPSLAQQAGHFHNTNGLGSAIGRVTGLCNTGSDGRNCRIEIEAFNVAGGFGIQASTGPGPFVINPNIAYARVGYSYGMIGPFPELPQSTAYLPIGQTGGHPDNHFGISPFLERLAVLAQEYRTQFPQHGVLCINDISLRHGGLFDLNGAWTTGSGHGEHQRGENADIRARPGTGASDPVPCNGMPDDPNVRFWFYNRATAIFGNDDQCLEEWANFNQRHYHVRLQNRRFWTCESGGFRRY